MDACYQPISSNNIQLGFHAAPSLARAAPHHLNIFGDHKLMIKTVTRVFRDVTVLFRPFLRSMRAQPRNRAHQNREKNHE